MTTEEKTRKIQLMKNWIEKYRHKHCINPMGKRSYPSDEQNGNDYKSLVWELADVPFNEGVWKDEIEDDKNGTAEGIIEEALKGMLKMNPMFFPREAMPPGSEEYLKKIFIQKGMACIILAGGYGQIEDGNTKLLEQLSFSNTILEMVFDLVEKRMQIWPVFVVVNKKFEELIRMGLPERNIDFLVEQENRVGTGGAVRLCLPAIKKFELENDENIDNLLILCGDMPSVRPETIERLIETYTTSSEKPAITMASVEITPNVPPMVKGYSRIVKDNDGRIIGILEPCEEPEETIAEMKFANPYVWIFRRKWLENNIHMLRPHSKGDGFPEEFWLHELVSLAANQNQGIKEIIIEDPYEVIGINTEEDLKFAKSYFSMR